MALPALALMQIGQGILNTGSGIMQQYLNSVQQRYYNRALQSSLKTQQEINTIQNARQNQYLTEQSASQVSKVREAGETARSSAKVAMAAQGIDLSSGSAQDVLTSSERAQIDDEEMIRYNNYLQTTENNRATALQNANLQHQINQSNIKSKYAKKGLMSSVWKTLLTGAMSTGGQLLDTMQQDAYRQDLLNKK